ncbi:Lytic transglycosylase catalytic [Actinobacteria bacterium OV450]|nr:Lytic transglycosylase catalytic [Actinobacteria bacterium OV450]
MATITSLGFHIFARYTGSPAFRSARNDIQGLNSRLDSLNQRTTAASRNLGGVATAAIALAPALAPLGAGLLAVAGGLAAATAAAGAGAGVFGFALKGAIDNVTKLKTSVGVLRDNLQLQKDTLAQLTPGTDAYARQLKKVSEAQDRYNHALAAMTPAQRQFIAAQDGMRASYQRFIKSTESSTLPVAAVAMEAMGRALGKLTPLVRAVAPVAMQVAVAFRHWVDTRLDGWVDFLAKNAVPAVERFITIGKNIGSSLGAGFKAFIPIGLNVVQVLAKGSANLKAWGEGGGFQRFLAYVQANGPAIREFFQALLGVTGKFSAVFIALGPAVLRVVTFFAQLVAKIPTPVLIALTVAWYAAKAATLAYTVTLWLAAERLQLVRLRMIATRAVIIAYSVASNAAAAATRVLGVALAFVAANPVVLIIAAIVALIAIIVLVATKTTWFQTAWKYTWNAIKAATSATWSFIRDQIFQPLVRFFTVLIPGAAAAFQRFVSSRWQETRNNMYAQFAFLRNNVWNPIIRFFTVLIPGAAAAFARLVAARWQDTRNNIFAQFAFIRDKIFAPLGRFFTQTIPGWATSMKNGVTHAFGLARDGIKKIWDSIVGIVKTPINFVIGFINKGVVGPMNSVAKFVGLKVRIPSIPKLAQGGPVRGPGGPTEDKIPAMLSNNEHVWTAAEVAAAGGHHKVAQMRSNVLNGRRVRVFGNQRFAEGGTPDPQPLRPGDVGPGGITRLDPGSHQGEGGAFKVFGVDVGSFAKKLVRGAMGAVTSPVLDLAIKTIGKLVGSGSGYQDLLKGAFTLPMHWLKAWIAQDDAANSAFTGGGNTIAAAKWADSQIGKPYVLGGAGNPGWDCSSFMSAIARVILGQQPAPWFTTHPFEGGAKSPVAGWERDLKSPFMIGITSAGIGHTGGTLNGVNYEATPPVLRKGPAARGANDPMFVFRYGFRPALATAGGAGGSGAWGQLASAVLAELGESPSNLANVLKAIQKESGGNANAINNWDSNAKSGTPSKGLLQVIDPTFAAFAGRYASAGIFDPKANIYAAINYARSRYGAGWSARMAAPGGYALGGGVMPFGSYDRGGYLPQGLSLAYNGTGKPEPVGHELGGEPHIHLDGTFIGADQRQMQDVVLAAWTELKRKNRV